MARVSIWTWGVAALVGSWHAGCTDPMLVGITPRSTNASVQPDGLDADITDDDDDRPPGDERDDDEPDDDEPDDDEPDDDEPDDDEPDDDEPDDDEPTLDASVAVDAAHEITDRVDFGPMDGGLDDAATADPKDAGMQPAGCVTERDCASGLSCESGACVIDTDSDD